MTTTHEQPPGKQQPDRLIIEVEVATMKRLLHELGAHCPFNECYKDILVMTKFCEEAEAEYRDRQRSAVIDEAKLQAVTEYQARQEALKVQADAVQGLKCNNKQPPGLLGKENRSPANPPLETLGNPDKPREFLRYGEGNKKAE